MFGPALSRAEVAPGTPVLPYTPLALQSLLSGNAENSALLPKWEGCSWNSERHSTPLLISVTAGVGVCRLSVISLCWFSLQEEGIKRGKKSYTR